MKYPEEFVKKVVDEYREWPGLFEMLRLALNLYDNASVEHLLDIGRGFGFNISPDKIIEHLDAGRVEQVKIVMERCIRREKLYYECVGFRFS